MGMHSFFFSTSSLFSLSFLLLSISSLLFFFSWDWRLGQKIGDLWFLGCDWGFWLIRILEFGVRGDQLMFRVDEGSDGACDSG